EAAEGLDVDTGARERARDVLGDLARLERRLVAPRERDELLVRKLGDQLAVLADDVAPELDGVAPRLERPHEREQVVEVNAALARLLAARPGDAASELERLVAADVHLPAREARQELRVERLHERRALGGGRERSARALARAEQLAEWRVGLVLEPA